MIHQNNLEPLLVPVGRNGGISNEEIIADPKEFKKT